MLEETLLLKGFWSQGADGWTDGPPQSVGVATHVYITVVSSRPDVSVVGDTLSPAVPFRTDFQYLAAGFCV